jgi:group I intron endonuclease
MGNLSAVYQISNVASGKSYIGSTVNFHVRRANHFSALRHNHHPNPHLQSAFNKHSEKSFVAKVVLICEPSELLRYEQVLIDLWKPEYNMCSIAGSPGGGPQSPEHVARRMIAHIGKPLSEETKARISASHLGKKLSAEARAKIARAHIGMIASAEARESMSRAQTKRYSTRTGG